MKWRLFGRAEPSRTNADVALQRAEQSLQDTRRRDPEVEKLSSDLRKFTEENGFTRMIRENMRRL